jgi:probable HAF family extracellular repeat protein
MLGEGSMSLCKASGLAIFAAVGLLGGTAGSAYAECTSGYSCATEWSAGKIINMGGLPNSVFNSATAINDVGQAVGYSAVGGVGYATQWSGGNVINLGGLPGSTNSVAQGINDAGQVVGESYVGGAHHATEWSGGNVINLGGLPGSTNSVAQAQGINDAGQAVGYSVVGAGLYATEWSGGSVIDLGALPGPTYSQAFGINDAGQAVGWSIFAPSPVPESSTWAMMMFGFTGLALAGYRRAKEATQLSSAPNSSTAASSGQKTRKRPAPRRSGPIRR